MNISADLSLKRLWKKVSSNKSIGILVVINIVADYSMALNDINPLIMVTAAKLISKVDKAILTYPFK